jgi:DNA-binding CsgD family transcriptional regulator
LRGLVADVTAGLGGAVLVEGEQGIGKTALLRSGLADAAAAGCKVAWAAADEQSQGLPLGLMTQWSDTGGPLAGLVEEAEATGPLPLAGNPTLAAVERLLALVDTECAAGPVVLVAEDLQWADEASFLVWRRLCRAAEQQPLLVAGSCRPAPVRQEAQARRGFSGRGGKVVSLGSLPGEAVAELVKQATGGLPGPRLAGLVARAGGNPLYVRELVDGLARDGRVLVTAGKAELTGDDDPASVPDSLLQAIGNRLGSLSDVMMRTLRWAAVLGPEFSVTDLETVAGQDTGKLVQVVAEAMEAGIIAEAGPRLAFRHGLIRQVLQERMGAPERALLHQQAAHALAKAGARPERVATQLVAASQFTRDWVRDWVRDWLAQAAPLLSYRAPLLAADLLRRVLAQWPAARDWRHEEIQTALVTVAFLLSWHDEAERAGLQVLASTTDQDRAAEVTWLVAYTLDLTGRRDEAIAMVEQALARPGGGQAQIARLHSLRALTLAMLGRLDEAELAAGEALAQAEEVGDRFAAGYALHALAAASMLRPDQAGMLRHINRALTVIGDDPRTADLRVLLLANRAGPLFKTRRHAEALGTIQQALALAERTGMTRPGLIRASLAFRYFNIGQWDDALAELELAADLPGPDNFYLRVHGLLALIAVHRDDLEAARGHLATLADVRLRDAGLRAHAVSLLGARARAAERAGRIDEAVAVLLPCLEPAVAKDMPDLYELMPLLTRLALQAGDPVSASAACAAAEQAAEREPLPIKTATADHCRGLLTDDPAPLLGAASYYQSAASVLDRGLALEDAAVLLARGGDIRAARTAFTEALTLYETLRASSDIHRAVGRLDRFGVSRGRVHQHFADQPTGWSALTPTEVKVAYLVAEGRSNPDIAAELFVSRNTVQTHVSHILAKLTAHSRAEIVRAALAHPRAGVAGP